jgi:HSP20 family molecular chaperone IbpA
MNCTTLNTDRCSSAATEDRRRTLTPRWFQTETEQAFHLQVDLPGVEKTGLDITAQSETLTIVGQRTWSTPEGWTALHRESAVGDYRLNLQVDHRINPEAIQARLENGVLHLTLGKSETVKPRKIEIKS